MFEATECDTDVFEACSRDGSIRVRVGRRGNSLGLQLEHAAMLLDETDLANRIMQLNTLAHLRSQLALRLEMENNNAEVTTPLATEDQVENYEAWIDF